MKLTVEIKNSFASNVLASLLAAALWSAGAHVLEVLSALT